MLTPRAAKERVMTSIYGFTGKAVTKDGTTKRTTSLIDRIGVTM